MDPPSPYSYYYPQLDGQAASTPTPGEPTRKDSEVSLQRMASAAKERRAAKLYAAEAAAAMRDPNPDLPTRLAVKGSVDISPLTTPPPVPTPPPLPPPQRELPPPPPRELRDPSPRKDVKNKKNKPLRMVCISDTHNNPPVAHKLPRGDVLVHTGDFSNAGSVMELRKFAGWVDEVAKNGMADAILLLPGNHERGVDWEWWCLRADGDEEKLKEYRGRWRECIRVFATLEKRWDGKGGAPKVIWLGPRIPDDPEGESIPPPPKKPFYTLMELKLPSLNRPLTILSTPSVPWTREGEWAFTYPPTDPPEPYITLPKNIKLDIILSHSPARYHLDTDPHPPSIPTSNPSFKGCPQLYNLIKEARPWLHVSGHVHSAWGAEVVRWQTLSHGTVVEGGCVSWVPPSGKKTAIVDLTGRRYPHKEAWVDIGPRSTRNEGGRYMAGGLGDSAEKMESVDHGEGEKEDELGDGDSNRSLDYQAGIVNGGREIKGGWETAFVNCAWTRGNWLGREGVNRVVVVEVEVPDDGERRTSL